MIHLAAYRREAPFSKFIIMRLILPEIIRQNEELRQVLLAQEGGIMKFLAEHLDANGTAELFDGYQNHCVEQFFERNKWDTNVVWTGDDMRRAALGEMEHLSKELRYWADLKPLLLKIPTEAKETIESFVEQYHIFAYKQIRHLRHPNGISPAALYREVIEQFHFPGLAYSCMTIILREHHGEAEEEKCDSDLLTEFKIRHYSGILTLNVLLQIRQAVAEMLIGKDASQCRQMAMDTMYRVRAFSQKIYSNDYVQSLRDIGRDEDADQRERDGKWLRDVAKRTVLYEISQKVRVHSLRFYFADFVNLLKDIGRIWAAQLLVHGIDMRKLEDEVCCIFKPYSEPNYYVDKFFTDDLPNQYCISSSIVANKMLQKLNGEILSGRNDKSVINDNSVISDSSDADSSKEGHSEKYYGKEHKIFHENLNVEAITQAILTLPRGDVKSDRKFFLTVFQAFKSLHWLSSTIYTKFISWMKFHSGIRFETNDFKNLDFDENMKILLPQIIAVFSDETSEGHYIDKDKFYLQDPQGHYLRKINNG